MKNKIHFLCALLISTCSLASGQSERQFRWQFDVGEKCSVELLQTTGITSNIDTRRKQIGNEMLLLMDWEIESVDENSITIVQTIRRIKLTIKSPERGGVQTTEIDTDSERAGKGIGEQLLKQIRPLLDVSFKLKMTTRGKIEEVTVPREAMDSIRESPASMILRQVLSEEGLKELLGQSAIVFPITISSGGTWTHTRDFDNSIGKIKKTSTYSYIGPNERNGGKVDEFAMTAEIAGPEEGENEAKVENFSGTGRIWFALNQPVILESLFENSMRTTRRYRDKTIVSSVSTKISMKVTKTN